MDSDPTASNVHFLEPEEAVELLISRRHLERIWPHRRATDEADHLTLRDVKTGEIYVSRVGSRRLVETVN